MKKIILLGLASILFCLVVSSPVSATPITGVHATVGSHISFTKISPSPSITRFQSNFQTTPMTRTFIQEDNGKTFTVSRGQVVLIHLDENPTTGYQWVSVISPGITIIGDSYKLSTIGRFGSAVAGAGGVRTWTLTMTNNGNQQFSADYKRSWEPGVEDRLYHIFHCRLGQKILGLLFLSTLF